MIDLYKALLVITAILTATPVAAQSLGSATTAFDGTYAGAFRQVETGGMIAGSTRGCALPDGKPGPLTIVNGVARAGSAENPFEGSVNAQGVLVMRLRNGGGKFEGQIDGSGRVTGRAIFNCSYQYVWQKESR